MQARANPGWLIESFEVLQLGHCANRMISRRVLRVAFPVFVRNDLRWSRPRVQIAKTAITSNDNSDSTQSGTYEIDFI